MTTTEQTLTNTTTSRRLMGDLTPTQVIASALAAVTSLALSRQIGVAGSLIGAAVGSVAASVAGALYRDALVASVEHVRSAMDASQTGAFDAQPEKTQVAAPVVAAPQTASGTRSGGVRRAFAVAACALVAGVLAVGAFAMGVNAATGGSGIGAQVEILPYVSAPVAPPAEDAAPADGEAEEATTPAPEDAAAPADDQAGTAPVAPADTAAEPAQSTVANDGDSQQNAPATDMTDTMGQGTQETAPAQEPAASETQLTPAEDSPAATSEPAA